MKFSQKDLDIPGPSIHRPCTITMNVIDKSERKFIRNAALAGSLLVKSVTGIWFKPARVIYGKDGTIKADRGPRKIPRAWRYEDINGQPYAIVKGSIQ